MEYIVIPKYSIDEIEEIIKSEDASAKILAITSLCKNGNDYKYALNTLSLLYKTSNLQIKKACIDALIFIPQNYGQMNLELVAEILRKAIDSKEKSLIDASIKCFFEYLVMYPEHEEWLKSNVKGIELVTGKLPTYQNVEIKKILEVEQQELCCDEMRINISNGNIEYYPFFRDYYHNLSEENSEIIDTCLWCKKKLGESLRNHFFTVLEKEYGVAVPDLENFSNIPEEFKTDEWWKKRGL